MMYKPLVLVVDDEDSICNFITALLTSRDYQVIIAKNGKEAIELASSKCPDLILLDLGLPEIDGREVLKTIRQWMTTPIIVVSARGNELEKVEALDCGADDYITKPFGPAELLARIRTQMRHSNTANKDTVAPLGILMVGDLVIDYEKRLIILAGKEIHFTPIEYKIIVLLSQNIGKVLTHEFITQQIWGPKCDDVHALRVNMANIRRKIEENPAEPKYIVTEVAVGYRMKDQEFR